MIYKKVEKIKEEISSIGIGCWNFGGDWDGSSDENTEKIVLTALENGINFFDIAPGIRLFPFGSRIGKDYEKTWIPE